MKLPDFLIIGAMKSGTTSLYRDLRMNSHIFMPDDKEPNVLIDDAVLTDEGRSQYAALFRRAQVDQVCGEASTAYTKRPTYEGVAARARAVLGPDVRVLYVVREPVSRAVSHHRHLAGIEQLPFDFDEALQHDATLVEYSRYGMQIEPWLEIYGRDRVHVICFETFVQRRVEIVREVCDFLNVPAHEHALDPQRIYNRSDGKPQMVGTWRTVRGNFVYARIVRPLLPQWAKEGMRRLLLPRERVRPRALSPATLDHMIATFQEDAERLRQSLDMELPFWDFEAVRANHQTRTESGHDA